MQIFGGWRGMPNYKFLISAAMAMAAIALAAVLATADLGSWLLEPKSTDGTYGSETGRVVYRKHMQRRWGRQPLWLDCGEGSADRFRYLKDECASEHLVEVVFDQHAEGAHVRLASGDWDWFTDVNGDRISSNYQLDPSAAAQLRMEAMKIGALSELPASHAIKLPGGISALEACISGRSFLAVKLDEGAEFQGLAAAIANAAGFRTDTDVICF